MALSMVIISRCRFRDCTWLDADEIKVLAGIVGPYLTTAKSLSRSPLFLARIKAHLISHLKAFLNALN